MEQRKKFELYTSPAMNVVELNARQMLCGSSMESQSFGLSDNGQISDGGDL